MASITLWRRPGWRCVLIVGHPSTLRLLSDVGLVREQTVEDAADAVRVARSWESELPVVNIEAVLDLLAHTP